MVGVAHSVRASDCGPEGSRFDPDHPPRKAVVNKAVAFFCFEVWGCEGEYECECKNEKVLVRK